MPMNENQLGDLPDDIGTDHNQLIDVPGGVPVGVDPVRSQAPGQKRIMVPGWMQAALNALVPHLFGSVRFTARPFVVGTDSIELSGGKPSRRYLLIQNLSPVGSLFLNFDNEASATNGVILIANAAYEPFRVPKNSINVAGSVAGINGFIIEG